MHESVQVQCSSQSNDFLSREIVLNQQKIIAESAAHVYAVSMHSYGFVLSSYVGQYNSTSRIGTVTATKLLIEINVLLSSCRFINSGVKLLKSLYDTNTAEV